MSLSSTNDSSPKADQIAHKFFNKFALLLHNARAIPHQPATKIDKWFNLETPDTDYYRDHLRLYRTLSSSATLPPFELQILLSVPELATNQVLVLSDTTATRALVDPTPSQVLLESWVVVFSPGRPYNTDRPDVALSSVYKQSISVFRSMFTLLRVLPAWKLFRKLRRPESSHLAIQVRVADPAKEDRMLKFGTPVSASASSLPTSTHAFPPVAHPLGTLTISTTYLLSPLFHIDTLESLLSSRFLSQDDESFTPTLAARQQTSISGSPMRSSQPRSPTAAGPSLADRFVLPASGPRGPPPASLSRHSGGSSGSGGSRPVSMLGGSRPVSTLLPRADSPRPGSGSGSPKFGSSKPLPDSSSSPGPGPLPIRRPSINVIHPFKSATLSTGGSPSLHSGASSSLRHSPLSAVGPSLPSRPPLPSSPSTRGVPSSSPSMPRAPPPSSPSPSRGTYPPPPSPMNVRAPSSDRAPQGRRFSSSFGYRYATTGGPGSDGSPGKHSDERERPGSASFLSTTTDDDDISAFVQAIDARAPLSVRRVSREAPEAPAETLIGEGRGMEEGTASGPEREGSGPAAGSGASPGRGGDQGVPRKYVVHVDAELKRMNEAFAQSLAGLERRQRRKPRTSLEGGRSSSESVPSDSSRVPHSSRDSLARALRPSPLLLGSGSASASPSGSAAHRRTGSAASGSDEIMGRLEFDDRPGSAGAGAYGPPYR